MDYELTPISSNIKSNALQRFQRQEMTMHNAEGDDFQCCHMTGSLRILRAWIVLHFF